ncbi:MAG: hypothetical protein C0392_04295 [Syntrophus sp. (in: bacteria)]|nr:hypothetical protein [Syntrophus sp. (in: bacteria)]
MDNIKAVDDLIKAMKLTREEWELFKDLIEETKDRERKIAQCSRQTRENLKKLSEEITLIFEQTAILSKLLVQILDEMEMHYLSALPVDRFYRE